MITDIMYYISIIIPKWDDLQVSLTYNIIIVFTLIHYENDMQAFCILYI